MFMTSQNRFFLAINNFNTAITLIYPWSKNLERTYKNFQDLAKSCKLIRTYKILCKILWRTYKFLQLPSSYKVLYHFLHKTYKILQFLDLCKKLKSCKILQVLMNFNSTQIQAIKGFYSYAARLASSYKKLRPSYLVSSCKITFQNRQDPI